MSKPEIAVALHASRARAGVAVTPRQRAGFDTKKHEKRTESLDVTLAGNDARGLYVH